MRGCCLPLVLGSQHLATVPDSTTNTWLCLPRSLILESSGRSSTLSTTWVPSRARSSHGALSTHDCWVGGERHATKAPARCVGMSRIGVYVGSLDEPILGHVLASL